MKYLVVIVFGACRCCQGHYYSFQLLRLSLNCQNAAMKLQMLLVVLMQILKVLLIYRPCILLQLQAVVMKVLQVSHLKIGSIKLSKELENQGIYLPERLNEDELHRFYTAANGDFSCFLASIKKTIRWRETYRILSEEELQTWSDMVFWHGFDVQHRPCLIVRLGLACYVMPSHDRPRFAQAISMFLFL
ncbi:hypothetical protein Patl1_30884 [Pistacia atlantica]|uniref:Uncharacterized protein n=1 Tax=Pistacia atlantica TaxID=434234 RepID=A0ACC1AF13_9ROSI|nr:hypothetical protein Patl1_30884 [Pistacia atlantica]